LRGDEALFNKENLFFHDFSKYDFSDLSFLNYQIFPNKGSFDIYDRKFKRHNLSSKPKIMSFKIFSSNHVNLFEKFYMKEHMYLADSFQYHFDADYFRVRSAYFKKYNLFNKIYDESSMHNVSTYMDIIKKERDFIKEKKRKDFEQQVFEFPFKQRFFYFGESVPYMLIFLFI
jgi:hypothetical protein